MIDKKTKILIVGLGLMGGSYAMALTKRGYRVCAITKEQKSVDFALAHGLVFEATTQVDEKLIKEADLIIFALYPHIFADWICDNQSLFSPGTIITDVTGVKDCIVDRIQDILRDDCEFIPAHPMAGRETPGVENSDDSIFYGANYIVTPTEKNSDSAVLLCKELGRTLGFERISVLSPKEHDAMIGFVSQLTHCIAVTLMTCNDTEHLEDYTGDSFRDLTRIARIDDKMWSELFLLNKNALLTQMDMFERQFDILRDILRRGDRDAMREIMRRSAKRRALFDKKTV